MADVELVIKIPEGLKKDFESEQWTALSCMEMKNALEKAKPLPEVLDKVRAEIEQLPITDTAVRLVTEILDKYKSEDKELTINNVLEPEEEYEQE